jgi:hypothetical protein
LGTQGHFQSRKYCTEALYVDHSACNAKIGDSELIHENQFNCLQVATSAFLKQQLGSAAITNNRGNDNREFLNDLPSNQPSMLSKYHRSYQILC